MTAAPPAVVPLHLTPEQAAELLARHEDMCWWLARKVCPRGRLDLLDDLAAEARARMWESIQTFDPAVGEFSTYSLWLAKIAALRLAATEARRGVHLPHNLDGKHFVAAPLTLGAAPGIDRDSDPLARPESTEERDQAEFWAEVARHVSPQQLDVLRWTYIENLSLREIAERLGCSRGGVSNVLGIARRALLIHAKHLREHLVER